VSPVTSVKIEASSMQQIRMGDHMADLSNAEVKSLAWAVGLEVEEPLLTEVTYNLNALRELIDGVNPAGLDQVEPLPVIPPHERSPHEHG
jgi:hypothetical protein